ncbi:MAG TPA: TIGR00725 family protein [Solirubrobacteraceae bacterium]|jgi:hypothetical protein
MDSLLGAQIGVIGASDATAQELEHARAVGLGLARSGALLITGGLGGVMLAACEGAHQGAGSTVGILPGCDRAQANDHVDVAIPTGMGELRNGLIVRCCEALIAIGGGWGTLSEIALALRAGRPVVGLESWDLPELESSMRRVEDPDQAVTLALEFAVSFRAHPSPVSGAPPTLANECPR